jgi:hypothetical protein
MLAGRAVAGEKKGKRELLIIQATQLLFPSSPSL